MMDVVQLQRLILKKNKRMLLHRPPTNQPQCELAEFYDFCPLRSKNRGTPRSLKVAKLLVTVGNNPTFGGSVIT